MAWKGRDDEIEADFNQLLTVLNNSRIQAENNALYQVIRNLIFAAQKNKNINIEKFSSLLKQINDLFVSITNINTSLTDPTYLTTANETGVLPNSRQELAGTNISFDDTVPGKRTINATGGGTGGLGAGGLLEDSGSDEPMMMPPGTAGSAGATGATGATGPAVYLELDIIDPDPPIPGPKGVDGAQGLTGPVGPAGLGIDGIDGEEGMPIPGIPGQAGNPGSTGPQGPQGIGLDGDTGDDGMPIPGTPGQAGNPGAVGPQGPIGLGIDGIDGEEYHIPGPTGASGVTGSTGPQGPAVVGLDGDVGDEGFPIPGSIGATGATGAAGLDGIQPAELLALIGKGLKRIWFLEQSAGARYQTNDLTGPDVPSEAELIALEEIDLLQDVTNVTYNQRLRTFGITIDGGGSVITTGNKGNWQVPYNGLIIGWTLIATDGLTGSIVVNVYKDTYANFPPTSADAITGGSPPTITSSNKAISSPTGWLTSFNAGDVFGYNVDSVSTLTRVTLEITALVF